MKPHDIILLLQDWTRRHFVVELADTSEMPGAFTTTTDKVHHISEMDVTTDACLDSMTVVPHVPPGNTVMVGKGKVQWFGNLIEVTAPMESPPLPAFSTADCDPYIADTTRWSLLCIRVDHKTGDRILFWATAKPGMGYPNVPYNGVPLALVQTRPGLITLTKEDILNWRSIRPGYAPSAMFWFEPVKAKDNLSKYVDPPEGASCLVLDEGVNYYFRNGAWRRTGAPTFDNTAFYTDLEEATTRIDLPWPISQPTELVVFRDGLLMVQEKDYHVYVGQTPYLIFTYNLMPGQRIVVMRNPFFAQAYSIEVDLNAKQIHDLWVDGINGSDAYDGTEDNPYRTLQHAFDSIPIFSNHTYKVHAKNLLRADMVSSPDKTVQRCYAYMLGKKLKSLQLIIDGNYEWYESQDEYVVYLNSVDYVNFTGATPVSYHALLVNCTSSFIDTSLTAGDNGASRVIIEGGVASLNRMIQEDDTFDFICRGNCIVKSENSKFKKLSIQSGGYVNMKRDMIENLNMSSGGVCDASYVTLIGRVDAVESLLYLHSCNAQSAEGNFSGGYLQAEDMSFPRIWDTSFDHKRFFYGHHGASFSLANVSIEYKPITPVVMVYNCTLAMTGGYINNGTKYAIEASHSCVISLNGTNFENNRLSAVYADYHCSVEFRNTGGIGNFRYACECYNISRANFDNSWTWGNMGQYYEILPGGDTVLADRDNDIIPGTLWQKLATGQGLIGSIEPSVSGQTADYQYKMGINVDELIGTGGTYGEALLNLNPKVTVHEHLTQIDTSGPLSIITMPVRWTGTSYIGSVTRRIFNPALQTKQVLTQRSSQSWFVEEDKWAGTTMEDDGVTLVNFPLGVGYKANNPHFFFTDYLEYGSLASYGISSLSSFSIDAEVPSGTRLQVAFSINGSTAWRYWNAPMLTWDILPGESTLIQMQSAPDWTAVTSLPALALDKLRQMNSMYITVCFLLSTTSNILTPKVKSFSWGYTEDGFLEDITSAFKRLYYSNRAEFTYDGSLGTIDPPVYFTVMPATDRR